MKKLIIVTIFLAGCSTNRVQLQPQLTANQTITYARGSSKLNSQSLLKPELTILEYSFDEMVISLTVTNSTSDSILFSEKNLVVDLFSSDKLQAGIVYSFEQLKEEAADRNYDTTVKVGSTAVGIGAGFIPFGSIVYSIGNLFYSIGNQADSYEERVDKRTFSQLNQNYIRKQTISSGERYSGILKIGFENNFEVKDSIIFSLSARDEVEKFKYICKQAEEK